MKLSLVYPLAISCMLITGCATITRGTTEVLIIESFPSGAVARLSNGKICITPCSLTLSRKESLNITFEKDGYESASAMVTSGISGEGGAGIAGNVIVGGVLGIGIDSYSGAAKSLIPNPVIIRLNKTTQE